MRILELICGGINLGVEFFFILQKYKAGFGYCSLGWVCPCNTGGKLSHCEWIFLTLEVLVIWILIPKVWCIAFIEGEFTAEQH